MEAEVAREKESEEGGELKSVQLDLENLDAGTFKPKDEVKRTWRKGTDGLLELGKVPSVLAKLERAEKAVKVVKGM